MIAFIYDDRLPHDRKIQFHRMITVLRGKFEFVILPQSFQEKELLEHLETHTYSLVLLPWYKYHAWKKVDGFFGSRKMDRATVAGYFADPVLPFDFAGLPNYNRQILLDFYRFDQNEIETFLTAFVHPQKRSGLAMIPENAHTHSTLWTELDSRSSHCVDQILALPLFQQATWKSRILNFRFFMTGLWTFVMPEIKLHPTTTPVAALSIAEFQNTLMVKALFKSTDYTLKHSLDWVWPNHQNTQSSMKEICTHSDFIRIHHYPETHHIELSAFFIKSNPAATYPNEVRGFWIEPLPSRNLKIKSTGDKFTHKKKVA